MLELKLFLGVTLDPAFKEEVFNSNPYLYSFFIGKEEYLQEIEYQKRRYLGKYLLTYPTLDQLEDLEKHLLSLIVRLAPRYSAANNPPTLLTLTQNGK